MNINNDQSKDWCENNGNTRVNNNANMLENNSESKGSPSKIVKNQNKDGKNRLRF